MSGRIPKPLQAALAAMLATMGAGGSVYLAEQERTSQLQTEYLRTVAADTSTSDATHRHSTTCARCRHRRQSRRATHGRFCQWRHRLW